MCSHPLSLSLSMLGGGDELSTEYVTCQPFAVSGLRCRDAEWIFPIIFSSARFGLKQIHVSGSRYPYPSDKNETHVSLFLVTFGGANMIYHLKDGLKLYF
jgi:hypothetical protein